MIENYIPIGIMMIFALAFGVFMSKASELFGPKNPTDEKLSTYESGMEPVRSAQERVTVKYYMVAMLFIIFDIEVVFLYPWAVNFRELGMFGFIEMFIFMVILFAGYIYVWKKGALDWSTRDRSKPIPAPQK
ncbi:MAG: NADH-quinone oxidoreductase subunit A [Bacteroidota bacterium]